MTVRPLRYWLKPPRTLDTYESDQYSVMPIAKNIYAPLVSRFLDGTAQGMIASRWKVDASGRRWQFQIRTGIHFDDGTPITPKDVLKNLQRILWLTKGDGLVLNSLLPGAMKVKKYGQAIPGLRLDGDSIEFLFARRPTNLFEILEQPLYAIVNPKCFGADGKWKEPWCDGASGAYRVKSISSRNVVLQSRHAFPSLPNAPELVELSAEGDGRKLTEYLGTERVDLAVLMHFAVDKRFVSELDARGIRATRTPPSQMYFVNLNHRRSPFNEHAFRESVRDLFLGALREDVAFSRSARLDASFFPPGAVGYLPFAIRKAKAPTVKQRGVPVVVMQFAGNPAVPPELQRARTAVEQSLLKALKQHGLLPRISQVTDSAVYWQRLERGDFDVTIRFTGVLIDDPYADLRMMFMSKAGALIPDPAGIIPHLIERAEASPNAQNRRKLVEGINRSIHDEAAVITFAHGGSVYLCAQQVDLSHVDLFSDPIEFRAVGWNPSAHDE